MNQSKKVALVTGSSRGIGRETAKILAQEGYSVVLHGKNPTRLAETADKFKNQGFDILSVAADVTNISEVKSMFDQIIEHFGRLDVLVTNASLTMESEFMDTKPEAFRQVVDSHIYGSVFPIKVMLEEIKRNRGSIILISSLAGLHGLPRFSAYCTGKMALTAFWQSLRIEQRRTGLHLGLVHLAFVQNDPDKTLINARGEMEKMPPRPQGLQQPQKIVAGGIYRAIKKRKNRTVLSIYGKTFAWFIRLFPSIIHLFLSKFFKT